MTMLESGGCTTPVYPFSYQDRNEVAKNHNDFVGSLTKALLSQDSLSLSISLSDLFALRMSLGGE